MSGHHWANCVPLPVDDIRRCAANSDLLRAVRRLYDELDADIAAHNPECLNRGACCRFEAFGHRLFVTPVELAYFSVVSGGPIRVRLRRTGEPCPDQVDGRCIARSARPAGCRIFFCDPDSRSWQPGLTERAIARLKELHRRFGVPYAYADWIPALEQMAAV